MVTEQNQIMEGKGVVMKGKVRGGAVGGGGVFAVAALFAVTDSALKHLLCLCSCIANFSMEE